MPQGWKLLVRLTSTHHTTAPLNVMPDYVGFDMPSGLCPIVCRLEQVGPWCCLTCLTYFPSHMPRTATKDSSS